MFFTNIGKTFTYEDISQIIYVNEYKNKINSIKLIIKELRKKLPKDTILNVYGLGYKV